MVTGLLRTHKCLFPAQYRLPAPEHRRRRAAWRLASERVITDIKNIPRKGRFLQHNEKLMQSDFISQVLLIKKIYLYTVVMNKCTKI